MISNEQTLFESSIPEKKSGFPVTLNGRLGKLLPSPDRSVRCRLGTFQLFFGALLRQFARAQIKKKQRGTLGVKCLVYLIFE